MDESTRPPGSHHFRGKARLSRRMTVRYVVLDAEGRPRGEEIATDTADICVGGAFLLCDRPISPGTMLELRLPLLPDGPVLELTGEVRWVRDRGVAGKPSGMGVRFGRLEVADLLLLGELVRSLPASASASADQ